jgi:predicted O-methyltransferase YrrM
MDDKTVWVNDKVYKYVVETGCRVSDLKTELRKETVDMFESQKTMLTSVDQGEFMKMMVALTQAKKGIEVGTCYISFMHNYFYQKIIEYFYTTSTFTGYSALCMAEGLPKNGKLICLDISEEYTDVAKKYWEKAGVSDRIELILGNGVETLDKLKEDSNEVGTFDFAFIDADKENYNAYYERLLTLLKPNGYIMIDNILWSGKVVEDPADFSDSTRALKDLADKIKGDIRVEHCMLPMADGISIVRKLPDSTPPPQEIEEEEVDFGGLFG